MTSSEQGWHGTLMVLDAQSHTLMLENQVRHEFRDLFTHQLEFTLPLEPGSYEIEVELPEK